MQTDSMSPCVCSVRVHRWRQNLVRAKKGTWADSRVCHRCSYILTSSVIYYWTYARQHTIYLYIIKKETTTDKAFYFYSKIFQPSSKGGLCLVWRKQKSHLTKSIVYTTWSNLAIHIKELWFVQEIHTIVKLASKVATCGMKTYSESRLELRNSPSLEVALSIAAVQKIPSENVRLWSKLEANRFQFPMKGALVAVEICDLCGRRFSNQSDIVSERP